MKLGQFHLYGVQLAAWEVPRKLKYMFLQVHGVRIIGVIAGLDPQA
jgi:hypothetical protein